MWVNLVNTLNELRAGIISEGIRTYQKTGIKYPDINICIFIFRSRNITRRVFRTGSKPNLNKLEVKNANCKLRISILNAMP